MVAHMKAPSVKTGTHGKSAHAGAEGNDVGLKAHHGGVDKALFLCLMYLSPL